MGSTFKMGAGMNVQDRLIALHDLDAPWRPGDLEQRSGRIIRQGNMNPEVHIYRYVTEATFDAYLWQTLENKQKFISQIMTSKSPVRSCDDIDETALSYAEIKALCAGDERIKEKMDLDVDVARLKLMKANHQSQQYRLEDNLLRYFPEQIEQNKGFIAGFEADMKILAEHPHPVDGFAGMTVRGDVLTDKENAGAALVDAFKEVKGLEPVQIGSYRGFQMSLTLEDFGRDYVLTLKGRMTHRVTLGKDPRGNLTRIDNALNGMADRLTAVQGKLDSLYAQMDTAKAELGKPFPQEAELRTKSARLAELNIELNIDDKTPLEALAEDAPRELKSPNPPSPLYCRNSIPTALRAVQNPRKPLRRYADMDNEKINVLVVEPEKKPYPKEISSELASLQKEVGGYIQAVYPYDEPVAIICDEEAKLKGSELNRVLRDEDGHPYDVIAGTFLVVGLGEEDFTSLTPEHMKQFKEKFDTPKCSCASTAS